MTRSEPPQTLGWSAILLLYVATLASMAAVGIAAALTLDLSTALHVQRSEIGFALSMFSLPSALVAVFCGGVVDRVGARRVLIASCLIAAVGSLLPIVLGGTLATLIACLLLNGVGFTGVSVAAPALIVTCTKGERRVRAMSIWSTYAPTAFAVGLLLGAPFAGTGAWVPPLALHAGAMTILAGAALTLPTITTHEALRPVQQLRRFGTVFREISVLRLAIAVAVPSALSYGTSLIAPTYIAEVHGTSMGASATVVAAAKGIAMLLCGIVTGALLSRTRSRLILFAALTAVGLIAQFAIFWPGAALWLAFAGLIAWLIAFGGMSASAMSLLSDVVRDPGQSGAASGLIGQAISVLSFLAPSVYFGMAHWSGYVMLAGAGLLLSVLALPALAHRPAPVA